MVAELKKTRNNEILTFNTMLAVHDIITIFLKVECWSVHFKGEKCKTYHHYRQGKNLNFIHMTITNEQNQGPRGKDKISYNTLHNYGRQAMSDVLKDAAGYYHGYRYNPYYKWVLISYGHWGTVSTAK